MTSMATQGELSPKAHKRKKAGRTYYQQVNPRTDLEWQPKPNNTERPPAAVLKALRKRAEQGLPLAGCEIERSVK